MPKNALLRKFLETSEKRGLCGICHGGLVDKESRELIDQSKGVRGSGAIVKFLKAEGRWPKDIPASPGVKARKWTYGRIESHWEHV